MRLENKKEIHKIAAAVLPLLVLVAPCVVFAVDPNVPPALPDPGAGLAAYLQTIYKWISYLTIAAAGIAFIMAAVRYMKGDKDSIGKARKYVESAVIAMIIVASAYLFFTILSPDIFK